MQEGITRSVDKNIGNSSTGACIPPNSEDLGFWDTEQRINDLIATVLGPKFQHFDAHALRADHTVAHLQKRSHEGKAGKAEEYMRHALISTAYRLRSVHSLGSILLD